MGILLSCCKRQSEDTGNTPDSVLKRQQLAAAAEKRMKDQESRGIKDPEKVRRQMQRKEEMEKTLEGSEGADAPLRWQVG